MTDANPTPPARGKLPLLNIARGLKLVALLCFLLPWITVSCTDQTLVSMSGYDLAAGSVTVHNPITGEVRHPPDAEHPEWPVLLAAVLILAALAVSFLLVRALAALAAIGALAAAALLISYSVFNRVPARIHASSARDAAEGLNRDLGHLIRVETSIGFWLTLAAIVGAIAATWMSRSESPP